MHDVDKLIANWKSSIATSEALRNDDLDELEEHLRCAVERYQQKGLSLEDAFFLAERKLGSPGQLDGEFSKTNIDYIWTQRIAWMLIGFVLMSVAFRMVGFVGRIAFWTGMSVSLSPALTAVAQNAAIAIAWSGLLYLLIRARHNDRGLRRFFRQGSRWSLTTAVLIVAAMFLLIEATNMASQVVMSRTVSVSTIGEYALANVIGGTVLQPLVIIASLVTAILLRRQSRCETST
ncbi:MAG: hypothetical protein KDA87_06630 [Planctomycetales bacterium]|nr:hypothetical protein [Planctomycetales bacterium]